MAKLIFLTQRMKQGYGVDVVVAELSRRLIAGGHQVMIVCSETDGTYSSLNVIVAAPHLRALKNLLGGLAPDLVIAHSAPYFDRLSALKQALPQIKWAVWEHGDPSPELFPGEHESRLAEKQRKQIHCYPAADAIVTISRFIRRDIGYSGGPQPEFTIYNGCDHAPDRGRKTAGAVTASDKPLRVGTLARLGAGEARYKGTADFISMMDSLRSRGIPVVPCFLGRGTQAEAAHFVQQGFEVSLNASDTEKWDYLRSLDVFVSLSLWEGFNLPLVEAQAMGTVGLALSVAAHPEVTENVYPDPAALAARIEAYSGNRSLLLRDSVRSYDLTRDKFQWTTAAEQLRSLISNLVGDKPAQDSHAWHLTPWMRAQVQLGRLRHYVRYRFL